MTQTTTAPSARYGRAFAEVYQTALSLTAHKRGMLVANLSHADQDEHRAATERLGEGLNLIGVDELLSLEDGDEAESFAAFDVIYAVLLRDRGLITAADFATIVTPWVLADLPLPAAVTGDDETGPFTAVHDMTSDCLGDELLHAAFGTDAYGAVLALTGYNHGELLAYPTVRGYVERRRGVLVMDWKGLASVPFHSPELGEDAADFLEFVLMLSPASEEPDVLVPRDTDRAEVMITAIAYANGLESLLTGHTAPQPRPPAGWDSVEA